MPTRTDTRAQFLADIITAAIEGGTGYWAVVHRYKWLDSQTKDPLPPAGVHAIIMEEDEEHEERLRYVVRSFGNRTGRRPNAMELLDIKLNMESNSPPLLYKLDIETIARGIKTVLRPPFRVRADLLDAIRLADATNGEEGDIDADTADVIVQAACFGELVYA